MRQLVDKHNSRPPCKDCIHIHFIEGCSFVFHPTPRNSFQLCGQFRNSLAPVGLYHTDNLVFATAMPAYAFAQHVVCLDTSRSIYNEKFKKSFVQLLKRLIET